jgi:hypothetical protein
MGYFSPVSGRLPVVSCFRSDLSKFADQLAFWRCNLLIALERA